jgi:hypothetical protein
VGLDEPHGTTELLLDEILNAACAHPFRARISAFERRVSASMAGCRRVSKAKKLLERSNLILAQESPRFAASRTRGISTLLQAIRRPEPRMLAPHIPAIDR